jgi:DNA-binding transcriptional regulator YbjK
LINPHFSISLYQFMQQKLKETTMSGNNQNHQSHLDQAPEAASREALEALVEGFLHILMVDDFSSLLMGEPANQTDSADELDQPNALE